MRAAFLIDLYCVDFVASDFSRRFVSSSKLGRERSVAIFVEEGMTSFEDWPKFTWLFG